MDSFVKAIRESHLDTSDLRVGNSEISLFGIKFKPVQLGIFHKDSEFLRSYAENQKIGLLLDEVIPKKIKELNKLGINFFTSTGEFNIRVNSKLLSSQTMQVQKKTKLNSSSSPTVFISPYGIAILDTILRMPESELRLTQNNFSKKFNLSQSRLSRIMTAIDAENLKQLKRKIQDRSSSWWIAALRYPRTKQRLTPFFEISEAFVAKAVDEAQLKQIILEQKEKVLLGPVEIAKELGLIRDSKSFFWVAPDFISEFKRTYKLSPARLDDPNAWLIATPKKGFETEVIISKSSVLGSRSLSMQSERLNIIRAIWDLGFGDSRLREVQEQLIKRIVNGSI